MKKSKQNTIQTQNWSYSDNIKIIFLSYAESSKDCEKLSGTRQNRRAWKGAAGTAGRAESQEGYKTQISPYRYVWKCHNTITILSLIYSNKKYGKYPLKLCSYKLERGHITGNSKKTRELPQSNFYSMECGKRFSLLEPSLDPCVQQHGGAVS